jgi:hypothetical protein
MTVTINGSVLLMIWAASILLTAWGAYLLGWRDAEFCRDLLKRYQP